MSKTSLDKETILNVAEEVIRRYGPDKAGITDVAKVLGVTHAAIYRYFDGKAALWDAVMERWLERIYAPLKTILSEPGSAEEKLRRWLEVMASAKKRSARDDPEMFAHYVKMLGGSRQVLTRHLDGLTGQIEELIRQGVAEGIFFTDSPGDAASAVFAAIRWFNFPSLFDEPHRRRNMERIADLLIRGLKNPS